MLLESDQAMRLLLENQPIYVASYLDALPDSECEHGSHYEHYERLHNRSLRRLNILGAKIEPPDAPAGVLRNILTRMKIKKEP